MTVKSGWIWLAVAPLAWMLQGAVAWYITGRACPAAALPMPFVVARVVIILITVGALVASVGALTGATQLWKTSAGEPTGAASAEGAPAVERRRFVALIALVVGVALTLGLLMAALAPIVLHACAEPR